ncbi:hypothetical protein OESDEN_18706 [Oesophagostomum dentatum]|uniref:Uncharacterized protein n=1 Tax=Oesophagostomum dentatum TaxID=61180 RepID=A0A0B1SCK0_OESDE|nr:hypothetical protein OESDEN_18706 [Oesophagostomum dentatum]
MECWKFFRNSRKKGSNVARTDFEENADNEWLRLPVPKVLNTEESKNEEQLTDRTADEVNCNIKEDGECKSVEVEQYLLFISSMNFKNFLCNLFLV